MPEATALTDFGVGQRVVSRIQKGWLLMPDICLGGCFTIPKSALQLTLFVFCRFDVTGTRMSLPIALVVGIAAGGATLLAAAAVLLALWCAVRRRARRNRNSDTGSSDPSTLGELRMGNSSLCTSFFPPSPC